MVVAVFLQSAFLGGITSQMYKQFAVTMAVSVVISSIVALTLSPALAALLLKPQHGKKNVFVLSSPALIAAPALMSAVRRS
ncbi:MAG: efflux RND transporter permease subunit [Candidatus Competibacteraceae bacterium]